MDGERLVEIYNLIDPRDGSVRYVGKANDSARRLKSHMRETRRRTTPVYAWLRKLIGLGMVPQMRVVSKIPASAWEHEEKRLIFEARLTHPKLLNVADGGAIPKCPDETRKSNGMKMRDHPNTIAQRKTNGENIGKSKHRVIYNLLRYLGQESRRFKMKGDMARWESAKTIQGMIKGLSDERKTIFAEKFAAKRPRFA